MTLSPIEKITVLGMKENEVFVGDVYQLGKAVIQISQPRNPCFTLSKNNHLPQLLNKMIATGFTGYLGRVLEEGLVCHDSTITLLERPSISVTIAYINQLFFHDKHNIEGLQQVIAIDSLAEKWRVRLRQTLISNT